MKKGQIVLYTFAKDASEVNRGQTDTVPAIVVAVQSDSYVNLRVFQDGGANPLWLTSVARRDASNEAFGNYWEPEQVEAAPAA